ncbi:hypothetical protein, partial [Mesorhizobium sp. M4A.F.Ca.ET.050.02.1.1]|uniref:hypothetical protein n=1 Tax=Mesorhizobium sp. M4A.F.Ca.ET.050.02.1.1 TaxID=2496754 RepID=UPI001AECCED9
LQGAERIPRGQRAAGGVDQRVHSQPADRNPATLVTLTITPSGPMSVLHPNQTERTGQEQ